MFSSAHGFRTALVALLVTLMSIVGAALWRFGSTPTDENTFTEPPSAVLLTQVVPGRPAGPGDPAQDAAASLLPGDLITAVDGQRIFRPPQYLAALARASEQVRVTVVRQAQRRRLDVIVDTDQLRRSPVRDTGRAAFVIDVAQGGASQRAGMRIGDLIVRINGRSFTDILEADAILRSGTVGHSTNYEVLRGGETLTLRVTLASFGLQLSLVMFSIAGIVYMLVGGFIGLARPLIPAARYLGLAFVLLGGAIGLLLLRRPLDFGPIVMLRDAAFIGALFFGAAVATHAEAYFPRTRPTLLGSSWLLPAIYGLAALNVAAAHLLRQNFVPGYLLLPVLILMAVVRRVGRDDLTAESRRILRLLNRTALVTMALVLLSLSGIGRQPVAGPAPGFAGLALLLIPAAYLWVIGRHRLLDLDLRLRRHVQYWLVSTTWGLLPLAALVAFVLLLPGVHLPIPNVQVEGSSIEVLQSPMATEQRAIIEKIVLMVVAIALAFGLRVVSRRGQQWLDSKFYRAEHDYRRAAKEVSKLVTARPDLEGLSTGLADAVVKLLQVKRVGAVFCYQRQAYCSSAAHGFTPEEWGRITASIDDILEGVRKATEEVAAEYVFPRLRRLLTDAQVLYAYPLRSHDELVGALLIGEKLAEDSFKDEDFEFLGALAGQVSPAIENAFLYNQLAHQERLKHELEIARRIQMESLPQFTPQIEGLDIAGISIPAFEVGGDYFDYLNGGPRRLTVMVGDVSGKGTSAALYMSRLQGIVRSLHAFDLSPHEFFVRTNDLLCRDLEKRSFVTAIGGFFDTAQQRMVLARAGHLPLYHFCQASRQVHRILPRGLGFGLSNRSIFETELEERLIPYGVGDVFLFITDGITECYGPSGDDFGEDRVQELLATHAGASAREIRDHLTSAVKHFAASEDQFDDQTVVVVKSVA